MKTASLMAACLIVLATYAIAGNYSICDLGTLGGSYTFTYGINNQGQVTGISATAEGDCHAFIWEDGMITDLGTLGGPGSIARGINDLGEIAGYSDTSEGETHAFLWKDGLLRDLGTLGGYCGCAYGINNAGMVIGGSRTAAGDYHAFAFDGDLMVDMGTLGGTISQAYGMNNYGQSVGNASTPEEIWHAVIWQESNIVDLGFAGTAYDINDSEAVVGMLSISDFAWHAFLYSGGTIIDLGTLGGATSCAYAINNDGQIVGQANTSSGNTVACLWENGTAIDLNACIAPDSGWALMEATCINDSGQIAGWGVLDGQTRAFLLRPETGITVDIDIRPFCQPNVIRLREHGFVPVAVLGADCFDPSNIDPTTVTLAEAPVAKTPRGRFLAHPADINCDGRMDLVLFFRIGDLRLCEKDTSALLTGRTFDGLEVAGEDSVKIVNSKHWH
jgi:probable HAF family extracellular repeat protein